MATSTALRLVVQQRFPLAVQASSCTDVKANKQSNVCAPKARYPDSIYGALPRFAAKYQLTKDSDAIIVNTFMHA